ncbi:hypothetical protein [Achromobacter sp. MYb9]|uniref:hypothetical protein n=1 Tax=Achromobacter sp. MYb9 TaxID=1827284 RepID=UPI0011B1C8B1|nr:hypothetical protein [Achromobacter sp. MYb9]
MNFFKLNEIAKSVQILGSQKRALQNGAHKALRDYAQKLTLQGANLNVIPGGDNYPWFIWEYQKQLIAQEFRKELLLPNLRDENLSMAIYSDYGGESHDSKYLTYSFLICAWNQTGHFHKAMQQTREKFKLNDPFKEISFKDFRYGPISRSLDNYLANLGNCVNGLLLTVVIEKSIGSIFGDQTKSTQQLLQKTLEDSGLGSWKPEVAEKIVRIVHFPAYLVALLSRPGQNVFWMTDNDSIAPTKAQHLKVLELFGNSLGHYCKHELGTIGGGVPFKEKDPRHLDLLSATDVVAGSVEHYFTRHHGNASEPLIREEANKVLRWLTGQGIALKKHNMIIRKEGAGIVSGSLSFNLKEKDPKAIFVPIVV